MPRLVNREAVKPRGDTGPDHTAKNQADTQANKDYGAQRTVPLLRDFCRLDRWRGNFCQYNESVVVAHLSPEVLSCRSSLT